MNLTIIGGGAWGTTIGQILSDNGHEPLIYDINQEHVNQINNHIHPTFDLPLPKNVLATTDLKKALAFSTYYILYSPVPVLRFQFETVHF